MKMDLFQGRGSAVALLGLLVAVQLMAASATNYTVGDSGGWGFQNYTQWVQGKTFKVKDVLEFNFATNIHTVLVVSEADFNSCTTSSPLATYTKNVSIPLNATGSSYYICGVTGHCEAGMKLDIDVKAAAAPTPSRSPTPAPTPSPKAPTPSPSRSPSKSPTPTPSAKSPSHPSTSPASQPSAKSPTPSSPPSSSSSAPSPSSPTSPASSATPSVPTTPAATGPSSNNGTSGAPGRMPFAGTLMAVGSAVVGVGVLFC